MTDADKRTEGGLYLSGGAGDGGGAGGSSGQGGDGGGGDMPPERRMLEPDILRLMVELRLHVEQALGGLAALPGMHAETERSSAITQAPTPADPLTRRRMLQAGAGSVPPAPPSPKQVAESQARQVEHLTITALLRAVATAKTIQDLMKIELTRREEA